MMMGSVFILLEGDDEVNGTDSSGIVGVLDRKVMGSVFMALDKIGSIELGLLEQV